jgi:hypothetical protein
MTLDPIVQEVREARASIAAEFGYDLSSYLVWIREQTQIRKESLNKAGVKKPLATTGQASQPPASVTRKRPTRPSRASAGTIFLYDREEKKVKRRRKKAGLKAETLG